MSELKTESLLMRFFKAIRMGKIAWSFRRLHCPVDSEALVLEVGSGGNPYPRANVLLDAYEETRQRHWVPLKVDRPIVLGFGEKLPFKDNAFDFVIASHVLEHSFDPYQFLTELKRVSKAGYIETPDAFMERINPYKDHRLEITNRNGKLIIRKKASWISDHDIVDLYENKVKHLLTRKVMPRYPFAFHVRYYWKDHIDFVVVNPEVNAAWDVKSNDSRVACTTQNFKVRFPRLITDSVRSLLSQNRRNKKIDLLKLLICPTCGADSLSSLGAAIICNECGISYPMQNGIPVLYPQRVKDKKV